MVLLVLVQSAFFFSGFSIQAGTLSKFNLTGTKEKYATTFASEKPPLTRSVVPYRAAPIEQYLLDNADSLGYAMEGNDTENMARGCNIWKDQANPMFKTAHAYLSELEKFTTKVQEFQEVPDLRTLFTEDLSNRDEVCKLVELDPERDLRQAFFNGTDQLSHSQAGYVEPLLPPMRHPRFCTTGGKWVLDLNYFVHDFGFMCRQLKKTSRLVLFDLGASLNFHGSAMNSPPLHLAALYRKFGFPFDHIYAFEVKPKLSQEVFESIPEDILAAYHWINVGVSSDNSSRNNPLNLLLNNFNKDDLIIVKLDIDSPNIENPLAEQLLGDTRFHGGMVDHLYYEHHVAMREIAYAWKGFMKGSIKDSLRLFQGLRERGIVSHFWV